jgi:DNA replicative helicase MCM subunit Mcm2 (Cdc46/Mcm family)
VCLVGGTKRNQHSGGGKGINIRNNVHVLLVGDPGLGKVSIPADHDILLSPFVYTRCDF